MNQKNHSSDKGYKQTEVGVIPEDWEVVFLGDLTTKVGSGITPTGGERVYKAEGRPFLRSQNVGWGKLILSDIAFIDDLTHQTFASTEIQNDDVFLNITGASIGRSAIADERVASGNVNQHVCIIRAESTKLLPVFLNYFLLSKNGQRQIDSFQAGGNRQGLNFGQIRSFQIPLPPTKAEQIAIATALSDADALIQSLEKLIAKKRNIKQGAMQKCLNCDSYDLYDEDDLKIQKKNQGNQKNHKNHSSDKWVVKKLGEIADIKTGKKNNDDKIEEGLYPFYVRSQNVERINSYSFDGEAILIPGEGNIGRIYHYINGKFDYHQRVYKISNFDNGYSGKYIYFAMFQNFNNHAM